MSLHLGNPGMSPRCPVPTTRRSISTYVIGYPSDGRQGRSKRDPLYCDTSTTGKTEKRNGHKKSLPRPKRWHDGSVECGGSGNPPWKARRNAFCAPSSSPGCPCRLPAQCRVPPTSLSSGQCFMVELDGRTGGRRWDVREIRPVREKKPMNILGNRTAAA